MANDIKEIGEIVKKCKFLLLDIEGTTTSISFVKDKLFPYAEENVKKFLETHWENQDVKDAVEALRKLALEDQDKNVEGVVAIPGDDASKEDQVEGLVSNVKWQMSSDRKTGALKQLQGLIWKQGYDSGDIKGHVFDDVSPALEQWCSMEGQKVYIYSSGSVQAQKLLFGQSTAGDLLVHIDGHFDTAVGPKQEAASYTAIIGKIGCKTDEVLFLTDIVKEAEAARSAGLHAALVSREGNAPLAEDAMASFPVVHSLAQLTVSNKRKPDPQDEVPAKVPKTESCDHVKSVTDVEETTMAVQEPEKMEVEETVSDKVKSSEDSQDKKGDQAETMQNEPTVTESSKTEKPVDIVVDKVSTEISIDTDAPEKMDTQEDIGQKTETTESAGEKTESIEKLEQEPVQTVTEEVSEKKTQSEKKAIETKLLSEDMPEKAVKEEVPQKIVSEKVPENNVSEVLPVKVADEVSAKDAAEKVIAEKTECANGTDAVKSGEKIKHEQISETIVEEITDSNEAVGVPTIDTKPIITETEETEKMETETTDAPVVPETKEMLNGKENDPVPEETPPAVITEIEDITEKQSPGEAADIIDNVEPVIEEPPVSEDMEELHNVGEVLEKECDDILSKVQDVTNLESIPLKPLLNSIPEETMETENIDSNDIVEGILETELELEMTRCTEIDLNSVADITEESKIETKAEVAEENVKDESKIEQKGTDESAKESDLEKTSVEESKTVENNGIDEKKDESSSTELKNEKSNVDETHKTESKEQNETKPTEEETKGAKQKSSTEEKPQVNGNATNGGSELETRELNGDASKDDLSSRLSVENGKEVNGSNGNSNDAEMGQGDSVKEVEKADIKVKSVATDERTDPIEQPTEA